LEHSKLAVDIAVILDLGGGCNYSARSSVARDRAEMKPTLVIVEDHLGCLNDLTNLIASDYEVVAVATDGKRGLAAALRCRPDVVILDISLPQLDGISAAREMRRNGLRSKILFLTVHEEPEFKEGAFRAGADGYVFKTHMASDILLALKEVLAERTFLSRRK
jgi:DNA-binding NarL/FixJ family response regulator